MRNNLKIYLEDPLLNQMYRLIREAGSIKSISLDITNECNLRCSGCYYFGEGMDQIGQVKDESVFDDFIKSEINRGTNFVTMVGGEPTLKLDRVKKIYDNFKTNIATNGLIKIPVEGFENLPIGIALWGDHDTDSSLRINGKKDLFQLSKENYKNDSRAFWYYTVSPEHPNEIEKVVTECIENGNSVLFNYFSDISVGKYDGNLPYRFYTIENIINKMISKFPGKIWMTPYFNHIISSGNLFEENWGFNVCTNLSENFESNKPRFLNPQPYNAHFRAYNADFTSTRRCCTGTNRDCASCYDTWEHFSWVMINLKKHLQSKSDFKNWLEIMFLFYWINKLIDYKEGFILVQKFLK